GSGVLADSDRASIATELEGRLAHVLGIANGKDGGGHFLFAGFQSNTQPFVATPTGATYLGDQGQAVLQVASGRQLASGETGSTVCETIRPGNGTFVRPGGASTAGPGTVGGGQVVTPAAITGHTYTLQFNVAAGVTTYDVIDATTSSTVSTGNAYTPGAS